MRFESGHIYHVYNRGNNGQQIFLENDNYIFFLKKIRTHLYPVVKILAYCLMPNHFHILFYVPEIEVQSSDDSESSDDYDNLCITKAIAVILRSYTRGINKRHNRTGSLFQQKTKAKKLTDSAEKAPFICFHYIHQNPMKAKLVNKMEGWIYSSFRDYTGIRNGTLCDKRMAVQLLDIPEDEVLFYKDSYNVQVIDTKVRLIL